MGWPDIYEFSVSKVVIPIYSHLLIMSNHDLIFQLAKMLSFQYFFQNYSWRMKKVAYMPFF